MAKRFEANARFHELEDEHINKLKTEGWKFLEGVDLSGKKTFVAYPAVNAPDAPILIGEKIVKTLCLDGENDLNPVGTVGTVVGSLAAEPEITRFKFMYAVQWPSFPYPVLVVDFKIEKLQ